MGVIFARNNGINFARGRYIYTLDSDDVIEKTTLEKCYKAICWGKGDIITTRVMMFGLRDGEYVLPKPNKKNLAKQNCLVNAALFRKKDFEKIGGGDFFLKMV